MADHDHAAQTEQDRPALGIAGELVLESAQHVPHEQGRDLSLEIRGHAGLELAHHELGRTLNGLEGDIAVETVAYDDVDRTAGDIPALAVAGKTGNVLRHERITGLCEGTALVLLRAIGQQTDARLIDAEDTGRIGSAHLGEPNHIPRLDIRIGAHVAHDSQTAAAVG